MKITIVTATICRTSLVKCCESVDNQTYKNYLHILMVDGDAHHPVLDYVIYNTSRVIAYTGKKYGVMGARTKRACLASNIPDDNSYLIYLDDDNYLYNNNSLHTLNEKLEESKCDFGIFPIAREMMNDIFMPQEIKLGIDTGNFTHKRVINEERVKYTDFNEEGDDYVFCTELAKIATPVFFNNCQPIINFTSRSYGKYK